MRRIHWIVLLLAIVVILMASIRVRHQRLRWGGYWSLELAAP